MLQRAASNYRTLISSGLFFGYCCFWLEAESELEKILLMMVTVKFERLEKFIELLLNLINQMVPRPIPAVYFMRLSRTITRAFSKYFESLYIFDQIFKYFSLFQHLCLFSEKSQPLPLCF